ncbi:DUF2169 family type VI secretion system accessory protein [Chondromyces apiculatus]|uniref:DUF2169 domain-containing protein n=1 Tax=Chondromyces apiculatus DSM 436 TaxID=1192034 RepID=A0A017TFM0_9BACT|nr:DUF2169 domain-containing protein [Chondromyces apiculatus]EYF08058.1 Hypothetical protein CAP_5818 [Chondromyces apiculatus DSM 436]
MDVVSLSPMRVGSILWQPRPGAWALTVVCKATYALEPGESFLAQEQEAPYQGDIHWEDDDRRSLRLASDFAPFKRRADVILVGHAYAPGRRPVKSLVTRLVVGDVDKAITVFGDRSFTFSGELLEPLPYAQMPLVWERAGRGADATNPVGVPQEMLASGLGRLVVPNLQLPEVYVSSRRDVIEPVCFGPIAPGWPGRARKLHWYASGWNHARWYEQPLPHDVDAAYFNAAPQDQQLDEIRPDERIMLENLHPDHPRLVTNLRPLVPRALVAWGSRAPEERWLRCDTMWIDTDRGTCSLTWRGYLLLDHPQQPGQVTITTEEGAARAAAAGAGRESVQVHETASSALVASDTARPAEGASSEGLPAADPFNSTLVGTRSTKPVLPFVEGPSTWTGEGTPGIAAPVAPPSARRREGVETLSIKLVPQREVLPFVEAQPVAPPAVAPPAVVPSAVAPPAVVPPAVVPPAVVPPRGGIAGVALSSMVLSSTPPAVALPTGVPAEVEAFDVPTETASAREDLDLEGPTHALAVEPPMIGPLARFEGGASEVRRGEERPLVEPSSLPLPGVRDEVSVPSMDEYPLERCAALDASLARSPDEKARILRTNHLTEPEWMRLREAWAVEVKGALRRGRSEMLRSYDAAYVAQLEKERGPVTVEEVARMNVGTERGDLEGVMRDVGLPGESAIRIQRTWIGRMASDAALGASVRKAVAKAKTE